MHIMTLPRDSSTLKSRLQKSAATISGKFEQGTPRTSLAHCGPGRIRPLGILARVEQRGGRGACSSSGLRDFAAPTDRTGGP